MESRIRWKSVHFNHKTTNCNVSHKHASSCNDSPLHALVYLILKSLYEICMWRNWNSSHLSLSKHVPLFTLPWMLTYNTISFDSILLQDTQLTVQLIGEVKYVNCTHPSWINHFEIMLTFMWRYKEPQATWCWSTAPARSRRSITMSFGSSEGNFTSAPSRRAETLAPQFQDDKTHGGCWHCSD
jgi:hypothetical protein